MLSKLKAECGANFTSKLEGMFQDIDLSKACQAAYSLYSLSHPLAQLPVDQSPASQRLVPASSHPSPPPLPSMDVQVLTTGYWPALAPGLDDHLQLPDELLGLRRHFESFYHATYQGRRLAWIASLGRCVLSYYTLQGGKKELEVSCYQAVVLVKCYHGLGASRAWSLEDIRCVLRCVVCARP
jgi:cullin-4